MNLLTVHNVELSHAPDRIVHRCQAPSDMKKIEAVCPVDQARFFKGTWQGRDFVMEVIPEPVAVSSAAPTPEQTAASAKLAEFAKLADAELQEWSAMLGVEWDAAASRGTMLDRLVEAALKPTAPSV